MKINKLSRFQAYLLMMIILNLPMVVFAAVGQSTFNPQGFMNKMLNDLMGDTSAWKNVFGPAATSLFLMLSVIEFSFDTGVRLLRGSEAGKMLAFAIIRLTTVALFLYFIKNVDWVFQILAQYKEWAYEITGLPVGYGPSEVAGIGVEITSDFFSAVTLSYTEILKDPRLLLLGFTTVIAGIFIMAAFGWAALQLFCIYVEFYLVVNAGIINLGFLGSSWTRDMGKKYFTYIIAVGTKILIALLIVAAVKLETATWASQILLNKNDFSSMLNVMTMLMVDSLMIAVMVSSIPAYAAGVISGISMASANQAASAGMGMAGGMAMTVGAAAGGAFMLYGSGKSAAGTAINAYRNRGGGSGDMSPGGASPTPPLGGSSSGSGASSAPPPNEQGGIGSGTMEGAGMPGGGSRPTATQIGMNTLGSSKSLGAKASQHWSNAQSSGHVSPPDLREKNIEI